MKAAVSIHPGLDLFMAGEAFLVRNFFPDLMAFRAIEHPFQSSMVLCQVAGRELRRRFLPKNQCREKQEKLPNFHKKGSGRKPKCDLESKIGRAALIGRWFGKSGKEVARSSRKIYIKMKNQKSRKQIPLKGEQDLRNNLRPNGMGH